MREILFRGKTLTGRWVEGSYYKQEEFYGSKEDADVIITSKESLTYDQALDYAIVLPETVGQYTGLTDKNRKKIFEGDIVNYTEEIETKSRGKETLKGIYEVKFEYCGFSPLDCLPCNHLEIIGNIHDNKELLEVK